MKEKYWNSIKACLFFPLFLLNGCANLIILNPKGDIGGQEMKLIIIAAALMLTVVIPAIVMTFLFAWRFRASNEKNRYIPNWHSKIVEKCIWIIPVLIVTVLSVLIWIYSHSLDPYKPIKSATKPLVIQVISMDWKWLFIYPDQNIATVNEIVFPVNVPVHFYLTSDTVINSFFIPQLGSQIMTMAGMQTQLYLDANQEGQYQGISSNFSGKGFTGMNFKVVVTSNDQFQNWVNQVKTSSKQLDLSTYNNLAEQSENNPVQYYSPVTMQLFNTIINKYKEGMCKSTTLKHCSWEN